MFAWATVLFLGAAEILRASGERMDEIEINAALLDGLRRAADDEAAVGWRRCCFVAGGVFVLSVVARSRCLTTGNRIFVSRTWFAAAITAERAPKDARSFGSCGSVRARIERNATVCVCVCVVFACVRVCGGKDRMG